MALSLIYRFEHISTSVGMLISPILGTMFKIFIFTLLLWSLQSQQLDIMRNVISDNIIFMKNKWHKIKDHIEIETYLLLT